MRIIAVCRYIFYQSTLPINISIVTVYNDNLSLEKWRKHQRLELKQN